jgi:hypothetical protein
VSDLSEREGFDGSPYPIVTIRAENGDELAVHAFHTVLANELARIRPKVGDELGIRYGGRVRGENSRSSYHSYRVRSRGSGQGVNWSRYGDGNEPAAQDAPIATDDLPQSATPTSAARFGDDIPWDGE